jgi:SAM-dependent methyltransferase
VTGWNAADYAANAGFVPALGAAVLDLLDPQPGERILDLGCGDGVLTARIIESGAEVLGLEPDPSMRAAAAQIGVPVVAGDGQALAFDATFDAVFSNAALHWMPDQEAVARGVFRALKPGGRYVGECGGFMNIAAIRGTVRAVLAAHGHDSAALGQQVYQTAEAFAARHSAVGFVAITAEIFARPTPLPGGIRAWLSTFRAGFLAAAGVPPEAEPRVVAEIEAALAPVLQLSDGSWIADYVRLRWQARKPETH